MIEALEVTQDQLNHVPGCRSNDELFYLILFQVIVYIENKVCDVAASLPSQNQEK